MRTGLMVVLLIGAFHTSLTWAADADVSADQTDAMQAQSMVDSTASADVDADNVERGPAPGGRGGSFGGGHASSPGPRPEPGRPDPVRPTPVRPEPGRPAPIAGPRPEPGRPDPVRTTPVRPEPGRGINRGPISIGRGNAPWPTWNHPVFNRPVYNWNWNALRVVTCTAEDSYGDQYPVTQDAYAGLQYQAQLPSIEDAALDRCYDESNGDSTCSLVDCTPGY
jgi:hypothetical protein